MKKLASISKQITDKHNKSSRFWLFLKITTTFAVYVSNDGKIASSIFDKWISLELHWFQYDWLYLRLPRNVIRSHIEWNFKWHFNCKITAFHLFPSPNGTFNWIPFKFAWSVFAFEITMKQAKLNWKWKMNKSKPITDFISTQSNDSQRW